MNRNYYEEAANWWTSQIVGSKDFEFTDSNIHNINEFERVLSQQIKEIISMNGSLDISTCDSRNALLDKIALYTGLNEPIPAGFEMKIIFSNIFIYNYTGALVAYF